MLRKAWKLPSSANILPGILWAGSKKGYDGQVLAVDKQKEVQL